ncbi:NADH dehydrogenase [ubiquinone] iron-sulfur protein 6, mitochondrial [Physcomitrium patens]|uniref:Zinc finger CHCC-type domain-containing protein n=1 Tax=Physcomitrium patens TaxID=3218 RepID=A0A2K1IFB1_PHYPA|nr:NADH dehydrogenase [ubiquinone] iron-sulfur protein 6, mitochondrial-like [Physcomitrium patens]PNR27954.1 hypothetical protein PHYPA_028546 [Physcomitrium patens]|eukprot:XP_024363436.1 NADH dehydrogenase [ubiquinone] iron-sulfur protein 6, mitochondrial-like [Physcomitrella patens]
MARSLRSLARLAGAARVFQNGLIQHPVPLAPLSSSTQLEASFARSGASVRFMSDDHTAKWMQNTQSKKSPMELINEVPPIKVDARVAACEGGTDPALGHPIEYICLDGKGPHVCKYCGLRYYQGNVHGHH